MLLGGLWHGASLNFIFWGGLHGLALMVDKARMAILPKPGIVGGIIGWFLTFNFVCACWVFFRAADFEQAGEVFTRITTAFHGEVWSQFLQGYPLVVGLMAFGFMIHSVPAAQYVGLRSLFSRIHPLGQAVCLAAVIVLVAQIQQTDVQPFIYFQF
jgi:D-alanyl-lipoteichoic acid acyltransferase DltB (MBOAT superfamily)